MNILYAADENVCGQSSLYPESNSPCSSTIDMVDYAATNQ